MKLDRLIGILSLLLQREKVTAPELAERFEVSRRTIQRDLEDPIAEAIIDSFESPISALRAVVREGKLELEKE